MKIILQRAANGAVIINGEKICEIGVGVVCFVGFHKDDKDDGLVWAVRKLLSLFLWDNDDGTPWKKSIADVDGGIIFVHDSGLNATVDSQNHPTFENCMSEADSRKWYDKLIQRVKSQYKADKVFAQPFGEKMKVDFVNDGPLTITIDSFNRK
ncbi:D-tyrosyl-tRNA(Tyr) deacylase [Tritrichomonas foetus]|uniref:D-aminoacyl-tRNA deacylase n=1 Tax=Tritrichomonas foetus TaxID=1144522 RepID=A0A1J4KU02_9EUKA|nr:D-tyrosyl-tRNA(Tyr) deacylase [Tritrichomonas foetus]|eukprot:OHT14743.1 D-tyrosyl-tRNA(Tyr) deacylase [Tritrichomonas foetus]